jgi:hypothetical protein
MDGWMVWATRDDDARGRRITSTADDASLGTQFFAQEADMGINFCAAGRFIAFCGLRGLIVHSGITERWGVFRR